MNDPLLSLIESPKPVPVDAVPGVYIHETPFIEVLAYADRLREAGSDRDKVVDANVRLIAASVCDSSGKLLYGEQHIAQLSRLPRRAMNALVKAISSLNGLDAKSVEAESKN